MVFKYLPILSTITLSLITTNLVDISIILLGIRRQLHTNFCNLLAIDQSLDLVGIETQKPLDLDTLEDGVGIPPDDVLDDLVTDDGIIITGLAFIRTTGLGVAGPEIRPVDGGAGQIPTRRKVGLEKSVDAALVGRVGQHRPV